MPLMSAGSNSFYGKILGAPAASKGGLARAKSLSPTKRSQIARKAAKARWEVKLPEGESMKDVLSIKKSEFNKHIFFFE